MEWLGKKHTHTHTRGTAQLNFSAGCVLIFFRPVIFTYYFNFGALSTARFWVVSNARFTYFVFDNACVEMLYWDWERESTFAAALFFPFVCFFYSPSATRQRLECAARAV